MKWINLNTACLIITSLISSSLSAKNEIGVVRASGDIAHSLLELLAGGRLNVDENRSHLTALRARLQDRPQRMPSPKFAGNSIFNQIASNVDDMVQINVDPGSHIVVSSNPKTDSHRSDELNFVEDTDEKNFVTEPYPPRTRTRNWMINRIDLTKTTTVPPPTTQFTLFPTFPTLFPTFQPLFAAFTPLPNPFLLPTTTTTAPIIQPILTPSTQQTTQSPPTTTTKVIDSDLLKPYQSTTKMPRRTKIVGARMKLGGETMNKQQEEDSATDQPDRNPNEQSENGDESGKQPNDSTDRPGNEQESGTPATESSNSGDSSAVTQAPNENSGSGRPESSNSGDSSATTQQPNESSGSGRPKNDDGNENSGSGSGSGTDDSSGNSSGAVEKCTDGRWSEWKEPTHTAGSSTNKYCSAECGACGRMQRERECLSFKDGKGCPCTGDYKQIEPCNIQVCKYPNPSCCPPYDLIHVDGIFACGPQEKHIMTAFKNSSLFRKHK